MTVYLLTIILIGIVIHFGVKGELWVKSSRNGWGLGWPVGGVRLWWVEGSSGHGVQVAVYLERLSSIVRNAYYFIVSVIELRTLRVVRTHTVDTHNLQLRTCIRLMCTFLLPSNSKEEQV